MMKIDTAGDVNTDSLRCYLVAWIALIQSEDFFFFQTIHHTTTNISPGQRAGSCTVQEKGFCRASRSHCWTSASVFTRKPTLTLLFRSWLIFFFLNSWQYNASTERTSCPALYSSDSINDEGRQDPCLCRSTGLTNTRQIESDSRTVPQISHAADSCASNCEMRSISQSNLICVVHGGKIWFIVKDSRFLLLTQVYKSLLSHSRHLG